MSTISPFGISDKNTYQSILNSQKVSNNIYSLNYVFNYVKYFVFEIIQNFFCKKCLSEYLYTYMYNSMMFPHTYIQYTLHIIYIFLSSPLYCIITYSPFLHVLPLFDKNAKGVCYMVMPKCDKKSKCTFKISDIVLSQFSCNTLLVCNAI